MLDFDRLREKNVARSKDVFHTNPRDEWTPTDWACAMAGEAGEACNKVKKLRRHFQGTNFAKDPKTAEEIVALIGEELADTILYADLLAACLGIDLSEHIIKKFNSVSDEKGSNIKL